MKKLSVYGATACGIGFASAAVALTGSSGEVSRSGISAASTAVKIGSEGSRITAAQGVASAVTVGSFLPSSADFPNPERGFYRWISPGFLDQWTQSDATDAYNNGYRILYARISLEDYKNVDTLPADLIARLNTGFGYARSAGVKLVVRFVYNYPSSETDLSAGDAPLARIKSHITQLSPLLRNNADVIAFLQAGFVGVWGEWHTSKNGFDDNAPGASNWAEVKDALLAAMPDDRFVQFRYPRHLMAWVPAASLPTVASAIQGKFRYGFHNDCFLSGVADIGTFSDDAGVRSQQRDYADRLGDVGPVGGETCDTTWSSSNVRRTTCADILGEGAKYNFTYLNISYWRPEFHDRWEASGCMPDVRRRMGYRLALKGASHPSAASRGGAFSVNLSVQNDGWARLYNDHPVRIVLQNLGTNAAVRITTSGADARSWVPGSQPSAATINGIVPSNLPAGQYRVLIALVDARLPNDTRYAIRFANENDSNANQYWDAALGAFNLGTTISVS